MITIDQAQTAVTILAAAFRSSMSEETAELLLRRFRERPFEDFDVLMATVGAAVDMVDFLPTVHQLVEAYQAEARGRIAAAQAADQRALDRAGHGNTPGMDERYGQAMARVLHLALNEAMGAAGSDESRGHAHIRGVNPVTGREVDTPDGTRVVGRCPVCSRRDEIAATMQQRTAELLAAEHVVPVPQPVPLRRCQRCGPDTPGFVVVDDSAGSFSSRPCPACQPLAAEAHAEGAMGLRRGVTR